MDDQAFIDQPTRPDLPELEDTLAQLVLEGGARSRELATLYQRCTEQARNAPEQELLLLRVADLLMDAGDPSGAMEILRQLAELPARRAMRRQRVRTLGRLEPGLLRKQDRALVLSMLLPLVDGNQLSACVTELLSPGQQADTPHVAVDVCLRALTGGVLSVETLEQVAGVLVAGKHGDQLERLVDQGARRALEGAASCRAPLLTALAGLAEEGLEDPARAAKLWWETWRCEGPPPGGADGLAAVNLKRIYAKSSDWKNYCRVLQREAMLAGDVAARLEVLRRLATVQQREMVDDLAAAETLGRILQLAPGDPQAVSGLQELAGERRGRNLRLALGGRRDDLEAPDTRDRLARQHVRREWCSGSMWRALWLLGRMNPSLAKNRELVCELIGQASDGPPVLGSDGATGMKQQRATRLEEALRRGGLLLLSFLSRSPRHLQTIMELARRLEHAGRRQEAAAFYRRVLVLSSDHVEARERLDSLSASDRHHDTTHVELACTAGELSTERPRRAALLLIQAAQLATEREGPGAESIRDYLSRATELGLALPPEELATLTSLEEALRLAEQYPELARVLEATAAAEHDPVQRKHILCELGRVHLEAGHHPERAVEALQQALMLDPGDETMVQRLLDLHRTLKDHRSRARNLESLLAHTSGAERVPLTEELGAIYSEALGEEQAAALHYEELLSHVPDHPRALPFCRAVYERVGDYVSVVRILGEAARVSEDRQTRARLHQDAARVAMQRLTDLDLAIHHWQDAIRARPEDQSQYEGLRQVLEAGGRWAELRETLLSDISRTLAVKEKLPLYTELARVARKQGDDQAAAEYLLSALHVSPGDGELLSQVESAYERLGQWRKLAVTLRRHADHESDPASQRGHLLRAARVLLIRLGRDDEALAICERIMEAHPGDREAATLMGEILGKRGQWEEKISLLRGQIEREDDRRELGRLNLELGRVLLDRLDDVETASVHFEVALNLSGPGRGDVLALLRRIYDARDRLDLLVELLQRRAAMKSLSPAEQAVALCEMARIKAEHLGEQDQATSAFERALELDPRCLAALSAMREQAAGRQQWWEALELARRELALEEDKRRRAALLVEVGSIQYEHLDEHQQAREALAEALEHDAEDPRALSLLGRIHFEREEWEETRGVTGRLVDLVRDQDDLHEHLYRLAFSLERLDREEEAFRLYIRSFTREPMYLPTLERMVDLCFTHRQWDNTLRIAETILQSYASAKSVEEQAELHLRIGLCELYLGQRDACTEYLQQLVIGSGDVAVAGPRAWTEVAEPWASNALEPLLLHCMRDELRDQVARAAGQCLKLVPDHSEALQVFAAVRLSQQNWEEGLGLLERAARSERTAPVLGAALLICAGEVARRRLGALDRARSYYRWAQNLDPSEETIKARLAVLDAAEKDQPILLTRPKRATVSPPPRREPPIRKRDTRPFRSGLFDKVKKGED